MKKIVIFALLSAAFLLGCATLGKRASVIKTPEIAPGATYVGSEACFECHEGFDSDRFNVHMRIKDFEVASGYKTGCESCHGPASLHVEGDGDTEKIIRFGEEGLEPEEVAGVCTTCHSANEHLNWAGSAHAENDVACTQCHKVHKNSNKNLLVKKELDLCAACHQDVVAQGYMMSHHPIREGKMGCTDCHSPHGSTSTESGMLRTDERVNDLCLKCHARYQGPFVFEHDPVVEDCLICHEPHGTVANNLLRQQEPFICLQCHEAHFHAARASNNVATVKAPGDGKNIIGPTNFGFQKSFMTKCTQCHQMVHGSDMPSQSVPGAGSALTR